MSIVAGLLGIGAFKGFSKALSASSDSEKTTSKVATNEDGATGVGTFDAALSKLLKGDQANNVNEEELFAAVATKRIADLKGDEVGEQFQQILNTKKSEHTRGDGYVYLEDATNQALEEMATSGTITEEELTTVKNEAFGAAQLDGVTEALFDGRGGEGDPTVATMNLDEAMKLATEKLEKYASGEEVAPDVSLFPAAASFMSASGDASKAGSALQNPSGGTITPQGTAVDGAGEGFLFKPESEKDGSLVVLLPADISHSIESVVLKNAAGEILDEGSFSSFANPDSNGDRAHYRFSSPGAEYGSDISVEVALSNGETRLYSIPNPGERYD